MAHKTKAAMQGRQCHYQILKPVQNTRGNAGGQRMSAPVITGTAPMAQFKRWQILRNSFRGMQTPDLADGYRVPVKSSGCADLQLAKGCSPLAHTPEISRSFEHAKTGELKLKGSFRLFWRKPVKDCAPQNGGAHKAEVFTETGENSNRSPDIGYQSLPDSLAFLRWRRLISPTAAVIRKPAVLSPLFFTDSISSNTSCGTRTFTCFDLLFTEPVAITESPCVKCYSLYAKKTHNQYLTCYAPSNKVNSTLIESGCKNGNAPDCCSSTGASNQQRY